MKAYLYRGDKLTDPKYKDRFCVAVLHANGKCIRGRNANMLVQFKNGKKVVVLARRLRVNLLPEPDCCMDECRQAGVCGE